EKQRLTAPRFLNIYKKLLRAGGQIEQKTDSEPFFDYSLEQFQANGFTIKDISRDLHKSEYAAENIVTEYEHNFASKGFPIFRAVAVKE
ncbi:MAG: tRNA (guanosine(46)-N7)-methyltransferase TrmB, partial [Clostridiales bacterium]|nr:tRNA (guanosine(46)-N7)-methyltransferase TrmB [Clostridiales bacterium]